ncbi:MAG: GTA-gp10 family protein [Pseudomonadota bacterium]
MSPLITLMIDGKTMPLRLTLGVLASLEERLGGGTLSAMQDRLKDPSVNDLLLILQALLEGGGATMTLAALKASDIDLAEAAGAIAKTFAGMQSESVDTSGGDEALPGKQNASRALQADGGTPSSLRSGG